MQRSIATGRANRLTTHFVGPAAASREARLGLQRAAAHGLLIRPRPSSTARLSGVAALRDRRGMRAAPARPVTRGTLRREPLFRWVAAGTEAQRRAARSGAAPWQS